MVSRLLLIRHAEIEDAGSGLFVGSTDIEAGVEGLEKLQRLHEVVDRFSPELLYCSPMKRTRQTMERIDGMCGIGRNVKIDDRLREIDFGRWEMKSFAEIASADSDLMKSWAEFDGFVFPEGESVSGFAKRIAAVLADFRKIPEQEIGVITHGGVIRAMICLALGLPVKNYLFFDVHPGSLTVLDLYPEGGILSGLNL